MAQDQLFEYVVLYHPKPTKDPAGNDTTPRSEIVVAPTRLMAKTDKEVSIKASRAISAEWDDKIEFLEVLVRPF